MSPAILLAGPHRRRSHGVIFKLKKRGNATFLVLHPHLQNAFTKPLQNPGLGQKKVVFSSKGSFVDAKEKLESVYPKLKDAGGFELLRMGSPNAKLFLINPPAGGYSVPFLRDTVGLGQALAYIWPLQMYLDTSVGESAQLPEQVCVSIAATHNIS